MFSHFESDGPMWTGSGLREVRRSIRFKETFAEEPAVSVGISLWDIDHETSVRADIRAEAITLEGFELIFGTWSDTRVARIRADWTAIGALRDEDLWEVD